MTETPANRHARTWTPYPWRRTGGTGRAAGCPVRHL